MTAWKGFRGSSAETQERGGVDPSQPQRGEQSGGEARAQEKEHTSSDADRVTGVEQRPGSRHSADRQARGNEENLFKPGDAASGVPGSGCSRDRW